jgi:HPt (histidine-containing phosphotransfer) domain-containing protein
VSYNPNNVDFEKFKQALVQTRARFVVTLGQQYEELLSAIQEVESSASISDAFKLVVSIAHKIAGVAKTLGFDELGRIASLTEAALDFDDADNITPEQEENAFRCIEDLLDGIQEARSEADAG